MDQHRKLIMEKTIVHRTCGDSSQRPFHDESCVLPLNYPRSSHACVRWCVCVRASVCVCCVCAAPPLTHRALHVMWSALCQSLSARLLAVNVTMWYV